MTKGRTETKIGNGYYEVRLSGWNDFVDYVCHELVQYDSYIWRGHRCDNWLLEPTIDRLIKRSKIDLPKSYGFIDDHLAKFQFAVRGRRGSNPPEIREENDWWALGQHHGLATPLLDWTTSPFVAAFFAFSETGETQTNNRAIFALHSPTLEGWAVEKRRKQNLERRERMQAIKEGRKQPRGLLEDAGLDIPASQELVLVRPLSNENSRLVNQGGLFTRLKPYPPTSMEEWVMKHHPTEDTGMSLIKILIPDADRDQCMRTLNRMNISHLSLFPDLEGASNYCNQFAEIDHY